MKSKQLRRTNEVYSARTHASNWCRTLEKKIIDCTHNENSWFQHQQRWWPDQANALHSIECAVLHVQFMLTTVASNRPLNSIISSSNKCVRWDEKTAQKLNTLLCVECPIYTCTPYRARTQQLAIQFIMSQRLNEHVKRLIICVFAWSAHSN